MSGFAGMIGASDLNLVEQMLAEIPHRGPDGTDFFTDEHACLGQNRLALQPTSNKHGQTSAGASRYQILWDGKVYNAPQLREHNGDHAPLQTTSDEDLVVRLYEEEGPDVVKRLDGAFAFVIFDKQTGQVAMARDPLGIKPLYYGYDAEGTLYVASEIKSLLAAVDDVREFPNGHVYQTTSGFRRYFRLRPPAQRCHDATTAVSLLRSSLDEAVRKRVTADTPMGVFLSGGLDSSLIAAIARPYTRTLPSFAVGMAGSADLTAAQEVAEFLGTEHHQYTMSPEDVRRALPDVIYTMESFDPALIRSAIATYFAARLASEHVRVVLSGEGADELFSGYDYLKELDWDGELDKELLHITNAMHNTNLQRVDRMTMKHSLDARVPFLDTQLVKEAFSLSPRLKLHGRDKVEKWILRKAAEQYLPHTIIWRAKEKFAIGTGTADVLREWTASRVTDSDFMRYKKLPNGFEIKSKEEMYYYRIFREYFTSDKIIETMGRSRSLDPQQRYA